MADYKIIFKTSVDKDLADIPKNVVVRVWQRLELLKQEPFPKQALKLEGSEGLHRLRVGDYRIIYERQASYEFLRRLFRQVEFFRSMKVVILDWLE